MKVKYVTSSNIDAVGHDADILYIKFHPGESYSYTGVSQQQFDEMTTAESVGKYFHRHIKGTFHYERLPYDPFGG